MSPERMPISAAGALTPGRDHRRIAVMMVQAVMSDAFAATAPATSIRC